MPAVQIRDLPVAVHRLLLERAARERRTIAQQAVALLTEALEVPAPRERRRAVLAELARSRKRYNFTRITPPEELIRADRNR